MHMTTTTIAAAAAAALRPHAKENVIVRRVTVGGPPVPPSTVRPRHLSLSIASILGHPEEERGPCDVPKAEDDDDMAAAVAAEGLASDSPLVSPARSFVSRVSTGDHDFDDNDEVCHSDSDRAGPSPGSEGEDGEHQQHIAQGTATATTSSCGTTTNVSTDRPSQAGSRSNDAKQTPSYTAIIAQAILSSSDKKLPLGNIYDYISDNFPEFLKKGQGWRNCVRHNLSLSECFVKAGRARNGRGNYWGIHPRYIKNFSKGDFRKRRASHRPRNRDLTLGLGGERLHYPPFLAPFVLPGVLPRNNVHRSFSVESILSPDRGMSPFHSYRPWIGGAKEDSTPFPYRIPTHCSQHAAMWMEQPKLHSHVHSRPYPVASHGGPYASMEHAIRQYEYYTKAHDYPSPPPPPPPPSLPPSSVVTQMKPACSCHMFCCSKS